MDRAFGGNAHSDRSTRLILAVWPRLLDVHKAADYMSLGPQTIRDWVNEEILMPVPMPGSTLRDRHGKIIAPASKRRIAKILIDRNDLDQLIEEAKRDAK